MTRAGMKPVALYICDFCDKPIQGNPDDPVHVTSLGRMHGACMHEAWESKAQAKTDRRSEGQKRRWAKTRGDTPEQA